VKYIFVTGGVVSGLGKGMVCASIGMLLKSSGYKVTHIKIDPYLNIDAGTMRPAEHGEVFVTHDGGEIDQDMGNYERFLNSNFTKDHNITSGKVYYSIIKRERELGYKGRDVEMIPDVPNEIIDRFETLGKGNDFVLVEIGGTTGDLENMPFLYAAREMSRRYPSLYILVSFVPFLRNVGELKTKPTQHAFTQLRSAGINADILITRNEIPLDEPRLETLAKRCFLERDAIFDDPDQDSIYKVPMVLESQGMTKKIFKHFGMKIRKPDLSKWKKFLNGINNATKEVNILLVGKYVKHGGNSHRDVYVSVLEALRHAGSYNQVKVNVIALESNEFDKKKVKGMKIDGILVPQGWGSRGTEGKIQAIKYARENKIPYLGLCFGMQMASIEFARNVLGFKGANSEEVDPKTKYPVIHIMKHQKEYLAKNQYGGTIRLGSWPCVVKKGTTLEKAYKDFGGSKTNPWYFPNPNSTHKSANVNGTLVYERHRHRYEFNNKYNKDYEAKGFVISGTSPDGQLVEAIELKDHPFFVGTQFHPEYMSRPLSPHPIFVAFIKAAME